MVLCQLTSLKLQRGRALADQERICPEACFCDLGLFVHVHFNDGSLAKIVKVFHHYCTMSDWSGLLLALCESCWRDIRLHQCQISWFDAVLVPVHYFSFFCWAFLWLIFALGLSFFFPNLRCMLSLGFGFGLVFCKVPSILGDNLQISIKSWVSSWSVFEMLLFVFSETLESESVVIYLACQKSAFCRSHVLSITRYLFGRWQYK